MVIILLAELVGLLFLRQKIAGLLVFLVGGWGGSRGQAIWLYSILTLPGVLTHETAHFLVAAFLGFRTGKIEMLPNLLADGGIELGSVQVEQGDPVRHSLVGLAPLVFGPLLVTWLSTMITADWSFSIAKVSLTYLITAIGLHVFPSSRDMRSWPVAAVLILVLGSFLWYLGVSLPSLHQFYADYSRFLSQMVFGFGVGVGVSTSLLLMLLMMSIVQLRYNLWKKTRS